MSDIRRIPVSGDGFKPYDVIVGQGLLTEAEKWVGPFLTNKRVVMVTDSHVGPLHADGILAQFKGPHEIYVAAEKLRDAGFTKWDTYAPFAVHGLDKAMGLKRSHVPWIVFFCGLAGFITAMGMVWFMDSFDYPVVVGGKPYFNPIYPFPVMYELTILLGTFGAFFGQFLLNGLPRLHHPVFNADIFARASDDGFFVLIEARDPKYSEAATRAQLAAFGGYNITVVSE